MHIAEGWLNQTLDWWFWGHHGGKCWELAGWRHWCLPWQLLQGWPDSHLITPGERYGFIFYDQNPTFNCGIQSSQWCAWFTKITKKWLNWELFVGLADLAFCMVFYWRRLLLSSTHIGNQTENRHVREYTKTVWLTSAISLKFCHAP